MPVKRNRFVQLSGGTKTVNREREAKARAPAELKGHATNLRACPDGTPVTAEFVIGAYQRLFEIEKSFRVIAARRGWGMIAHGVSAGYRREASAAGCIEGLPS